MTRVITGIPGMGYTRAQRKVLRRIGRRQADGDAAKALLRRWHEQDVPTNTVFTALEAWAGAIRFSKTFVDPQLAFWFLSRLIQPGCPPAPLRAVRLALRLANAFPYLPIARSLLDELRDPSDGLAGRLLRVAAGERSLRMARRSAAVSFDGLRTGLEALLTLFAPRHSFVTLCRSTGGTDDHPIAFTDGSRIHFPTRLALSVDRDVNERFAVYVLAHEAAHLESGTFVPEANEGAWALVERELRKRRRTYLLEDRRYRLRRLDEIRATLSKEGRLAALVDRRTKLCELYLHYSLEQRRFLQLLVNIFEDSRIDAWLLQRYPGLRRAWMAVTRIARSVRGAAVLRSQEANLLWAVQDVANGWRTTAFVGGKYAFVWGKIQRILEARRE